MTQARMIDLLAARFVPRLRWLRVRHFNVDTCGWAGGEVAAAPLAEPAATAAALLAAPLERRGFDGAGIEKDDSNESGSEPKSPLWSGCGLPSGNRMDQADCARIF